MNLMTILSVLVIVCVLVSLVTLFFWFLNEKQTAKLRKRFDSFSLKSNSEYEISFLDSFASKAESFVKKYSKVLQKSHVLQDYSKKYEKYISYEEKETKKSMDFISIKFLIGFFFVFLQIIVDVFKISKGNVLTYLLSFLIGFFMIDIILLLEYKKKRQEMEEDLLKAIMIMNNSFKSGKNIMQAIGTVKNELEGPISDEFKKIYMDITYGLSLEVVFSRFYERVKLEDAKLIASSLTLLNKTGGNIIRVFETIEKSFFTKKRMHDELNSLTASSIFVFRVLVALPPLFTAMILLLNPMYFNPLFKTPIGILLLASIILLYSLYIRTIKRILEVKM